MKTIKPIKQQLVITASLFLLQGTLEAQLSSGGKGTPDANFGSYNFTWSQGSHGNFIDRFHGPYDFSIFTNSVTSGGLFSGPYGGAPIVRSTYLQALTGAPTFDLNKQIIELRANVRYRQDEASHNIYLGVTPETTLSNTGIDLPMPSGSLFAGVFRPNISREIPDPDDKNGTITVRDRVRVWSRYYDSNIHSNAITGISDYYNQDANVDMRVRLEYAGLSSGRRTSVLQITTSLYEENTNNLLGESTSQLVSPTDLDVSAVRPFFRLAGESNAWGGTLRNFGVTVSPVPEPSSVILLSLGSLFFLLQRKR